MTEGRPRTSRLMRRNAALVTADKRFSNRLANTRTKSHVIHLADWT